MMRGTIVTNLLLVTLGNLSDVHARLGDDPGRTGHVDLDPARLHVPRVVQLQRPRVRLDDRLAVIALGALFSLTYAYTLRAGLT